MKFEHYEGIHNSYHDNTLDKIYKEGGAFPSRKWSITEKVHGSHFDIAWDGVGEVEFWSRNRKLPPEENFYNYFRIKEYLAECIERAYKLIIANTGVVGFELIICGELFGGNYPHKDVKPLNNVKGVQDKLFYYQDIGFYSFDVKINGEFINYYSAYHILDSAGFQPAEILFEGTFEECMKYPNDFQTTIPEILGLPPIEGNICEGVVLKPIKPERFLDGNRVILKNKNEKWKGRGKPRKPREPLVLTDAAQEVYDIISTYVTQNRLDSVMSKINRDYLTKKQGFKTIMGDFRKDIMVSFIDDYGGVMGALDKQDKSTVSRQIGKLCVPLVKAEWMRVME